MMLAFDLLKPCLKSGVLLKGAARVDSFIEARNACLLPVAADNGALKPKVASVL